MVKQLDQDPRFRKRAVWASAGIIVLVLAVIFGISGYAAHSMTVTTREPITQIPVEFGLRYSDISFPSTDGLTLRGWWLEGSQKESVIIMVHGVDANRADPSVKMLDIAADLVNHGYNVLMFDLRGHGESDGAQISAGYFEKRDVLGAVNYVRQRGISKIGVLSYSMGAAASLMAAAENQDILAVVADSSYADLEEIINHQFSIRSSLPPFFIPLILFMDKTLYGIDFRAVKPVEAIKNISGPVFIIVGGKDDTVSTDQAQREFEASRNPQSQIWIVPEAEHTRSYTSRPQEYIEKVETFFDRALANN
jgi:uncharacterized protein